MRSYTTGRFRAAYVALPASVLRQAREAYAVFQRDPYHPSLRFKMIHPSEPIWSVRIGRHYRAVGVRDGDIIAWYWIGSHAAYDTLIRLR